MSEQSLEKRAALAIRQLQAELQDKEQSLQEQSAHLEHFKRAQHLSTQFLKIGHISLEKFEDTVQDLNSKTSEELDVIEKAAAMTENGNGSFLGKVAEDTTSLSLSAAERFVQALLEDD